MTDTNTNTEILEGYILGMTEGHRGAFDLCDLELNNTARVALALTRLQDAGRIVLMRNDDPRDRRGRSFEISVGGQPRHLLYRR